MKNNGKIDVKESYRTALLSMSEGKPLNEDVGDWFAKKLLDLRKNIVKTHMNSNLFNPMKNAMKAIARGNYRDAVTKIQRYGIKLNSASPTGIKIFKKRYEQLPFGIAAVAYPISIKGVPTAAGRISEAEVIIREMFTPEIQNLMALRAAECHKYQDILSFVLTAGGTDVKKEIDNDTQLAILKAIKNLMELGWNPGTINQTMPGFVDYIMRGNAVSVVKALHKDNEFGHKLTISPAMNSTYGIEKDSELYNYIATNGPHKFALHEPDVTMTDGKITGGTFTQIMSKIGYDIANPAEQSIPLSNIWVLQEQLGIIIKRYQSEGEKFSNIEDINIFAGSAFAGAKAEIKKIMSECKKLAASDEWKSLSPEEAESKLDIYANRFMVAVATLNKSLNSCLKTCGLPPVKIAFKTDISNGIDAQKMVEVLAELGIQITIPSGQAQNQPEPTTTEEQPEPTTTEEQPPSTPEQNAALKQDNEYDYGESVGG